jgi:hypothetical protein
MKQISNLLKAKKARSLILLAIAIIFAVALYVVHAAKGSGGCTRHDRDPKDHDYVVIQC